MNKLVRYYWPSIIFAFMVSVLTITSTWVKEAILLPNVVYKVATLFVYLPFIAVIVWKLINDLKHFKDSVKKATNIIYYSFAVYYAVVSAYRFFISAEVKESLYYSIILFGSIALYLQLSSNTNIISKKRLQKNVMIISLTMALVRFINYFFVGAVFKYYPINVNIMCGLNIITLPFLVDFYKTQTDKKNKIITLALITLISIEILTSAARMMCMLAIGALLILALVNFKNKNVFKRILTTCLCALLVVVILFVGNVKNTRYAIYREFSFVKTIVSLLDEGGTSVDTEEPEKEPEESLEKVESFEQTQRSDSMRRDLINIGIKEVTKNPLFGTGNVTFLYTVGEYKFEQSSHNFLIEALNCYGIVGILFILLFIIFAIIESKIFDKKNEAFWQNKVSVILTFGLFFAMGCLQPLVFNILICPVFMMIFAVYHKITKENVEQ